MASLKILVIAGYKIFPVESGGAHVQLAYLAQQQKVHSVSLLVTADNIEAQHLPAFKAAYPDIELIPFGYGGKPVLSKPAAFIKKQYRKFSGRDLAYQFSKLPQLNGLIINDPGHIEFVQKITSEMQFDIVQIEHVKNLGLITAIAGSPVKIFVHHEIFFDRVKTDMLSLHYSDSFATYIATLAKGAELYWLNFYDAVITLSEEDSNLLKQNDLRVPQMHMKTFPLFENELNNIYDSKPQPTLTFLGGEAHYPNKDGLIWFLNKVLPLVLQSNPDVQVRITGSWSANFQDSYAGKNVSFTGYVKNLDDILKTSILIVPIRIGSGIRVKVFTSFAKGIPIVSTTLGASGITGLKNGDNIMLADDAEMFASCCTALLHNEQKRKTIGKSGYELAEHNYDKGAFTRDRNDFYGQLILLKHS